MQGKRSAPQIGLRETPLLSSHRLVTLVWLVISWTTPTTDPVEGRFLSNGQPLRYVNGHIINSVVMAIVSAHLRWNPQLVYSVCFVS
jgi:hypothetical protein